MLIKSSKFIREQINLVINEDTAADIRRRSLRCLNSIYVRG